jgi:hypothetical protein
MTVCIESLLRPVNLHVQPKNIVIHFCELFPLSQIPIVLNRDTGSNCLEDLSIIFGSIYNSLVIYTISVEFEKVRKVVVVAYRSAIAKYPWRKSEKPRRTLG